MTNPFRDKMLEEFYHSCRHHPIVFVDILGILDNCFHYLYYLHHYYHPIARGETSLLRNIIESVQYLLKETINNLQIQVGKEKLNNVLDKITKDYLEIVAPQKS
ncbi:hypothetical protein Glove_219g12 [Diversispora epigaea]|uniref:Uncharacterized protein n=1 Tax=Diversispora epigaea TaxID=1348612 RepID=A0A397IFY1_9GLOM|nr:hypothetical protein Glove_219g12 [Diversispora epigaea]